MKVSREIVKRLSDEFHQEEGFVRGALTLTSGEELLAQAKTVRGCFNIAFQHSTGSTPMMTQAIRRAAQILMAEERDKKAKQPPVHFRR